MLRINYYNDIVADVVCLLFCMYAPVCATDFDDDYVAPRTTERYQFFFGISSLHIIRVVASIWHDQYRVRFVVTIA